MPDRSASPGAVCFADFEVDLHAGELRKRGKKIKLQEQPFRVLGMLLEKPAQVVTRAELQEKLWSSETFVDFDHGLNKAINKIRAALGDSAESPRFVETVGRRGYRFIMPVAAGAYAAAPNAGATGGSAGSATAQVTKRLIAPVTREAFVERAQHSEEKVRLVVLPLENLSADPEQEFFSDGLTEEMITQLARLHPKRLGVIARTTAMHYKHTEKDIHQVGKELGVEYVLEGSVRRSGSRVRISIQLIECRDQTHLWAESYDRDLADLFLIQSEVAESVAQSLEVELMPLPGQPERTVRHTVPGAYEDYLRGLDCWNQFTPEGSRHAIAHFARALGKDGKYAPAYVGLSLAHAQLAYLNGVAPSEAYPLAKAAALQALQMDNTLAGAYASLGLCSLFYYWDWRAAEQQFGQALLLEPGHALTHHLYALYLAAMNRLQEALAEETRALELDPLSLLFQAALARYWYFARDYLRAAQQCRQALELGPDFHVTLGQLALIEAERGNFAQAIAALQRARELSQGNPTYLAELGQIYARAGRKSESRGALQELHRMAGGHYVSPYFEALIHIGLGENAFALACLEKACQERYLWLVYLNVDPALDALRPEGKFKALAHSLSLDTPRTAAPD